ncbi:unnamed protein product [Dicrocoelium dendriticum]|nr:unnamed protein product [Dicrocoelium dendriticum]
MDTRLMVISNSVDQLECRSPVWDGYDIPTYAQQCDGQASTAVAKKIRHGSSVKAAHLSGIYLGKPLPCTAFNRPHRRPVLLFVHGESYEYGTGNAYDLSVLAGFSGTVCITLNYRLGILGFLSLKEGHSNGNFALFDLQAAILWIRTNIERFGGDPDQMTLMGYGHGAALIHLFSLSRLAQGAISKSIKRLILLNGSGLAPWATSNSAAEVNRALEKMLLGDLAYGITHNSSLKNLSLSELQTTRVSPAGTSAAMSEQQKLYNKAKGPIASQNRSEENSSVRKPTLGELVFKQLKQLSVKRIIQLQNNLSDALCASRLGPVLSKHLFPSLIFSESSIFGATSSGNGPGTDRTGAIKWESTLFARADLLVGLVEKPGASFYRKSQWTDSLSAEKERCLQNIFPHDPRAIAAVVDFFYENGDQEAFSEQSVDGRRPRSTELDQILTILSDGLYLAPAVQTLQLHLSLKKADRQPSTAKARTFLAMFRHHSLANSAQTNQREMNKTTVTGSTFGEDLAYWMGAPLVNNKTMNLFPGPYTGDDAAVSRKLLFLLTTFIHKG